MRNLLSLWRHDDVNGVRQSRRWYDHRFVVWPVMAALYAAALGSVPAAAQSAPDLRITGILVGTSPTPFGPGPLQFGVNIRNAGDAASATTTLRIYQSEDATISTSDTELGTAAVAAVAPSDTISVSSTANRPSNAITYYYGVCVDAVAGESDTTNNCSGSLEIPTTDLVVGSPSMRDSDPVAGATSTITLSATVRNDGNAASAPTTLRYYRSADAVAGLAASGSTSESVQLTAPSTAGTYYYGACVDTVADESDTTNNCSTSVQVDVAEAEPPP